MVLLHVAAVSFEIIEAAEVEVDHEGEQFGGRHTWWEAP